MTERSLEEIRQLEEEDRRRRFKKAQEKFKGLSDVTQVPGQGLKPSRIPVPRSADVRGNAISVKSPEPEDIRGQETEPGTGMESGMTQEQASLVAPSEIPGSRIPAEKTDPIEKARRELDPKFPGINFDNKLTDPEPRLDKLGITLTDLARSLLGGFLNKKQRKGVTIILLPEGGKGIRIRINTTSPLSPRDERPFSLNQAYSEENGLRILHIETIVAPGEGKRFFKSNLLPQAEQLGIQKITLNASGIGGSREGILAWARYGFVPTPEAWNEMRSYGLGLLKSEKNKNLAPFRSQLEAALQDSSPEALRWLIYLSWKEREAQQGKEGKKEVEGQRKKGAAADFLDRVLGHNTWDGELDLTDPDSRKWIQTYVNAAKPEDQLTTFEHLLKEPRKKGFLGSVARFFKKL